MDWTDFLKELVSCLILMTQPRKCEMTFKMKLKIYNTQFTVECKPDESPVSVCRSIN